jgi:hypothetical protein
MSPVSLEQTMSSYNGSDVGAGANARAVFGEVPQASAGNGNAIAMNPPSCSTGGRRRRKGGKHARKTGKGKKLSKGGRRRTRKH